MVFYLIFFPLQLATLNFRRAQSRDQLLCPLQIAMMVGLKKKLRMAVLLKRFCLFKTDKLLLLLRLKLPDSLLLLVKRIKNTADNQQF